MESQSNFDALTAAKVVIEQQKIAAMRMDNIKHVKELKRDNPDINDSQLKQLFPEFEDAITFLSFMLTTRK